MVDTADWFSDWFNSDYYHKLYFERDEEEAALFIDRLLSWLQPITGAKMLDVACGKGRHSRFLAQKGFDVTGIDISPASILEAKRSENENLHFFEHDMRLPFYINYFDIAFNFFTSFGYFRTEREHMNAIRTISSSLQNGGRLVIDYLNVHYAEDHLIHHSDKQIDDINFHITKWFDETHFYKKIEIEDENNDQPFTYTERVAKFSLGDFNDMFAFNDLQLEQVFGDYQLSDYDIKRSPRMILVARKKRK